eukprot:UN01483
MLESFFMNKLKLDKIESYGYIAPKQFLQYTTLRKTDIQHISAYVVLYEEQESENLLEVFFMKMGLSSDDCKDYIVLQSKMEIELQQKVLEQ